MDRKILGNDPEAQVCSLFQPVLIATVLLPQQVRGNLPTLSLGFPEFPSAAFALLLSRLASHSTVCYFQQNCLKSLFTTDSALAHRLLLTCV